jgi:ferritin-like metal-binding protein YciE
MRIETLKELLVHEMEDLYDAEHQIVAALPLMEAAASSRQLKAAFKQHTKQTEGHVKRLEKVFQLLGAPPNRRTCKGVAGLLKEGQDMIKEKTAPDIHDAGLIAAAQKVEHYEIAGYGTLRTWAQHLGTQEAVTLLQQTLDEEGETDKKLTALAEGKINEEAAQEG